MARSRKTALTIFVFALAVYLISLSNSFNGDGLGYARLVESADSSRLLSVSARLLFCPIGKILHEVVHFFGFPIRSVRSLQLLNALFGAAGVAFLFLAGYAISKSRWLSLTAALGFGGSLTYWYWSTNATSYPGNICFLVLTLYLLLRLATVRSSEEFVRSAALIGVAHALAGLFWLTAVLLAPAVAVGIIVATARAALMQRLKASISYAVSFMACLFLPLLAAGFSTGKVDGLSSFSSWLTSASYGIPPSLSVLNISRGIIGFSSSMIRLVDLGPLVKSTVWGVPFVEQSRVGMHVELGAFILLWIFLAVMASSFALSRKRIFREHSRHVIILCLWSIVPAVFGLVWLGSDTERWLAVLPGMWLLLVITAAGGNGKHFLTSPHLVKSLFVIFALAVVAYNAAFSVIPDRDVDNNEYMKSARFLDLRTGDADLVMLWGHDHVFTADHLAYFYGKRATHVGQLTRERPAETFDILQQEIEETYRSGGKVFVIGRLFLDSDLPESHVDESRSNISREQIQEFFSHVTRKVAFSLGKDSFWEIVGEP